MSAAERLNYYPPQFSVAYPKKYTEAEYFEIEANSDERLEFVNGFIIKLEAGGTHDHSLIGTNVAAALHAALRGKPCNVHGSDLKTKTDKNNRYPDAMVICGKPEFANESKTVVANPTLLVEVVSVESATRDYVTKRLDYFKIPSLIYYMVIEQASAIVSLYIRTPEGVQLFEDYTAETPQILLPYLDITLDLVDIYEGVDFENVV